MRSRTQAFCTQILFRNRGEKSGGGVGTPSISYHVHDAEVEVDRSDLAHVAPCAQVFLMCIIRSLQRLKED